MRTESALILRMPLFNVYLVSLLVLILALASPTSGQSVCSTAADSLTVAADVTCSLSGVHSFTGDVDIQGTVLVTNQLEKLEIEAATITVRAGASIRADGNGPSAGSGTGAGTTDGSGGSYGGRGGHAGSAFLQTDQATAYGSTVEPADFGSGGGGSGSCTAASGGGYIKLTTTGGTTGTGTVTIDGLVSANGNSAQQNAGDCGGGSGGSIFISTNEITGSGFLSARGGNGQGTGGGGGGGRIAVRHKVYNYLGKTYADGGLGGSDIVSSDSKISSTSASSYHSSYSHSYGKMASSESNSRSWRPSSFNTNQYLQLNLDGSYYVTGIQTRGDPNSGSSNYYVKTYNVEYYNTSSTQWVSMNSATGEFTGNTDRSSLVTTEFRYPVLTNKIKVLPLEWNNGIGLAVRLYHYSQVEEQSPPLGDCNPSSQGSAGGPGTVYMLKEGDVNSGSLAVDNFGKEQHVKAVTDCSELDVRENGAAAWLLDTVTDLDDVILGIGSHLAVAENNNVSHVYGETGSMLHVLPDSVFTTLTGVDTNCFVYSAATLELISPTDVQVYDWLYVKGTFSFQHNVDFTITANTGNFTIQAQTFSNISKLQINVASALKILGDDVFNITVMTLNSYGDFIAGVVDFTDIDIFRTGALGSANFDPVTSNEHLGRVMEFSGDVALGKPVSFYDCDELDISGGRVTWDISSLPTVVINCDKVIINQLFTPGIVDFDTGITDTLQVGASGDFRFYADGSVLTDSLAISGRMEVYNAVDFNSKNETDKRIAVVIIHSPDGQLLLNTKNSPKVYNGTEMSTDFVNNLRARYLTVNGVFTGKELSIDPGIDALWTGSQSHFTFTPRSDYLFHTVSIDGILTSSEPLELRGISKEKIHTFVIGETGVVTFDSSVTSSRLWTGVSTLAAHTVDIHGQFFAGNLKNHYTSSSGWDVVTVYENGQFEFEPERDFRCNYISVSGTFFSYTPITIQAHAESTEATLHIQTNGTVHFDGDNPDGPWNESSYIRAATLQMDIKSYYYAADTKFVVDNMVVHGSLYADPSSTMEVESLVVGGDVVLEHNATIEGTFFSILNGGLVNLAYQKTPEDSTLGSTNSLLQYTSVTISGTLLVGSLTVEATTMLVTGTVDATSGGYLANEGPGAGVGGSTYSSGGSHGGRGGAGYSSTLAGQSYGTIFEQHSWGSGGGGSGGGRGGGRLDFHIIDDMTITGTIRANGGNAQTTNHGGGSGGGISIYCRMFTLTEGPVFADGGNGISNGGGGAGGRFNVLFVNTTTSSYYSNLVQLKGGTGYEAGGPGMAYFCTTTSEVRHLRLDNKCQQPRVSEPSGSSAGETHFNTYVSTGAIAYLRPENDGYVYDFTLIEVYGSAHLTTLMKNIHIRTEWLIGDDTGHVHIPPSHTLEIDQVLEYKRVNVTCQMYIYENATWILPEAEVEFRQSLNEYTTGINSGACSSGHRSGTMKIWGYLDGAKARLLVAAGATLVMELSAPRVLTFANITIQGTGIFDLQSTYGDEADRWHVVVRTDRDVGVVTVEGVGQLQARNLYLDTDIINVHYRGLIDLSEEGLYEGEGAGTSRSGGGYGGRGGKGPDSGSHPGQDYGSVTHPHMFGSGGAGASSSAGAGGGILELNVRRTLIVEGNIAVKGQGGTTNVGGGSGGSLLIVTHTIEGSGNLQVSGGPTSSTSGGGGGGRMALYYKYSEFWYGGVDARGGSSPYGVGGAGTIYLEDTIPDVENRTLVIDNFDQDVSPTRIGDISGASYLLDGGRTYYPHSQHLDYIYTNLKLVRKAHLALHPSDCTDTNSTCELDSLAFAGDSTGVFHVGPGQTVKIQHPDDNELLVNVYVEEGGVVILPPDFECYNTQFHVWGTLAVEKMTVGQNCDLYLGATGTTRHTSTSTLDVSPGTYYFKELIVGYGGEVTATSDLTSEDNAISIQADYMHVRGEGHVHAVHVNIEAQTLIVDDRGRIVGDLHSISCSAELGGGVNGQGASGGGHGGHGGPGSHQPKTGYAHGQLYDAEDRGCAGGASTSPSSGAGGRGGGVIWLVVTEALQNDGTISCSGEAGTSAGGGGSGGSININVELIKGYGEFQVIGGDGSSYTYHDGHGGYSYYYGGGGSGGRISMNFANNKTFSGSWDIYGGLGGSGAKNGGPGTAFFYHTGYNHSTLLLNNLNRGPDSDTGVILDYDDLSEDWGHAWFLPQHGQYFGGSSDYYFDELQIYGQAQLAILPAPQDSTAKVYFEHMIGDRTGAVHVGNGQMMDLERPAIDLPFSVHVYNDGYLGLAPDTIIHDVEIFLNGTLAHIKNLTIHHGGTLWLFLDGKTEGLDSGNYEFEFIHVKTAGYMYMRSDPVYEPGINFTTRRSHVDGGGLVHATHLYFFSQNFTVDSGGLLSADGLGHECADGTTSTDFFGYPTNAGQGYSSSYFASGAGHGGSGGRGNGVEYGGLPYGDLYEPTQFGSCGGGSGGGAGGGRLWLNISDTLLLDGIISANGMDGTTSGSYVSGGGSGGSIWLHLNVISGFGSVLSKGGSGSTYSSRCGGGGAGGRIAMYFHVNKTLSEFRFLASGGAAGSEQDDCESGGPGTAFVYHMLEDHRTLIIDNDGLSRPKTKYVNWDDISKDGCRAWILPFSGIHDFAAGAFTYHFEELQIYGNGDLAILPPSEENILDASNSNYDLSTYGFDPSLYNLSLFFKYMIGDRSGSVHVAAGQVMDLEREEIDLPFNCYAYPDSYLGLAPITFVHGVEIHLAGILGHVRNLTLHHGGYMWLKNGGRTAGAEKSFYVYDYVRIQDDGVVEATTDPIVDVGITFTTKGLVVEGGGLLNGTKMTFNSENITVDAGGHILADALGYTFYHRQSTHGVQSLHGDVNIGLPDEVDGEGCGAGHGGSGGKHSRTNARAGFAYGNIYEPDLIGSAGGPGPGGTAGGSGGGVIWMNVTDLLFVDGIVSVDGGSAINSGAGGGSGGSMWVYTNRINGYGKLKAHGGDGKTSGSGGAGGRIAVYLQVNESMSVMKFEAFGGEMGGESTSENGGAGTVFVYHLIEDHRTIIIDNGGRQPRDHFNVIPDGNYHDLTYDSCRTWIMPESGEHDFAHGNNSFHFEELQMYGAAHLAFLAKPVDTPVNVHFLYMIGDRTGTVHLGYNQTMDLNREEIDLPFSARVYDGAYLGLAPFTVVHNVSIWLHETLANVENITLRHNGLLSLEAGGHTRDLDDNYYFFEWVRLQDTACISSLLDAANMPGIDFYVNYSIIVEGGGKFVVTDVVLRAINFTIDSGGSFNADGNGYDPSHTADQSVVNRGLGTTSTSGSSGGGHGGTSGRGAGTPNTGQPYGHLYQPSAHGSAGGGGAYGGSGGGKIWIEATNLCEIDGELSVNGGHAVGSYGGGGSAGSLWMFCRVFRGLGNITLNGGDRYPGGTGGGGAGGRAAIYFSINNTYLGQYQGYGGDGYEPGGPGTFFFYHKEHNHTTLYINNDNRVSSHVTTIENYEDLLEDSFKAWILPESTTGTHAFADGRDDYRFDELQIYGNAHLAVLPQPFTAGSNLHFLYMIGDRSGFVHVGPYQIMDLRRQSIDTPFSSYVYEDGYLGLAPETDINGVFVDNKGRVDHIMNLTLVNGGKLLMYQTGSVNHADRLNVDINGTTVVKADSLINASTPNAHSDQYNFVLHHLTVEGGGEVRAGHMKITSNQLTVDDGGKIGVDNGGHLPGNGNAPGIYHKHGSSGASHAGLGGRGYCDGYTTCRLPRNDPYGSLYLPLEYGSGGAGSRGGMGGGILELVVTGTLSVDGTISANSWDLETSSSHSGASGGSAGSLYIRTQNFTGGHTGHIQVLGGAGNTYGTHKGGGGSGGRTALYHNNHHTVPPYRGYFEVYGGWALDGAEAGAAGTAYVEDGVNNYKTLIVDNNGQTQIAESTAIDNEGYRLELGDQYTSHDKSTTYTFGDVTVTSSGSIYNCYSAWNVYCYVSGNTGSSFSLASLFDQTLSTDNEDFFLSSASSLTLTITLGETYFVNKMKVYPISRFRTRFKVTGYDADNNQFEVTSYYVEPPSSIIQGSYVDLPLMRYASKFTLELDTSNYQHTDYSYAALSEIEIFVNGIGMENRYEHLELAGASTWIYTENAAPFYFDEVQLRGNSHLAFMNQDDFSGPVHVETELVDGDGTGWLHVGYGQNVVLNGNYSDIPFNVRAYETSILQYPPRAFLYKTKLYSSGWVHGLEDVYVFDGGVLYLDTNGTIGDVAAVNTVSLKTIHVQDEGTFQLFSYNATEQFQIDATNITIYGGGHFKANLGLYVDVSRLYVYSGGKLDLDGAGDMPNTGLAHAALGHGSGSGGSGAGHGGSGGRGAAGTMVGLAHGSMYEPTDSGGHGGYGYYYSYLYFGDEPYGNQVVPKGLGGGGGGPLEIVCDFLEVDGSITSNGLAPDSRFDQGAGGGSGGSIWVKCAEVIGHGLMSANGGDGGGSTGGGGAGGRISVQSPNLHKFNITLQAHGGVSSSETGGAGTKYLESRHANGTYLIRKMSVDNNGHQYPRAANMANGDLRNLLNGEYNDISYAGGVTFMEHESTYYSFIDLVISGNAHVAILSDTDNEQVTVEVMELWGDKTGVLHCGKNQTFGFTEVDIYLPVNFLGYRYSQIELPDRLTVREVWVEMNGTIKGMDEIAVENEGELYVWSYANTYGYPEGEIRATNITVRAGGKFEPLSAVKQLILHVVRVVVNGRGYVRTNNLHLIATNVTIDLSVFLRLAHILTFQGIKSTDVVPCTFHRYMQSMSDYKNRINLIRATLNYTLLDGEDPVSKRPDILYVKSRKLGYSLHADQLARWFSPYGSVDIQQQSSTKALVATSNFRCARDILSSFRNHNLIYVTRYRVWKHSPIVRGLLWSGAVVSGGICMWLLLSSRKDP